MTTTAWSLSTPAGALEVLEGSSWALDRGWSPMGQGTVYVPLDAWLAAGLDARARVRMVLEARGANYAAGGTTGATWAGAAGAATWPVAGAAYLPSPRSSSGIFDTAKRWNVELAGVEEDIAGGVARLDLATFELALHELRNLGPDWLPTPRASSGDYLLSSVIVEFLAYVGQPIAYVAGSDAVIPAASMSPWPAGATAWDFIDRARQAADRRLIVDATLNTLRAWPRVAISDGSPPTSRTLLALAYQRGGAGDLDGRAYADAVSVRFRWTDSLGDAHEEVQTAYAAGVSSWRDARRAIEFEREGRPIAGYAARVVDELRRWGSAGFFEFAVEELVPNLEPPSAGGEAQDWQTLRFTIGDAATIATASVIIDA